MTDCLLARSTDPALCWCPTCKRTLPIRLLHAHRNCAVQPEPRPEEEQAALVEVCKGGCPDYGDPDPGYAWAPVCQLDAPPGDAEKEPCRKKNMVAAYQKRVRFPGGELCGKWKAYLESKS